jgi:hypothetical protein
VIATWENEVVEFKQAGNDYSTDEKQKGNKISSLRTKLRRQGTIVNTGWQLAERN